MSLPPAWKVKRELRRVYEKAKDAVALHPSNPLRQFVGLRHQRNYDRNLANLLRETPGARPLTQRVAAFILFQPKGIAGSTFLTLDHLAQEGWSVLVISNAPLSDADRARLAAASSHVIERPNVGYDFGAYREAWRWLHRHGHALDRLILMNDSTWFPLRMNDDSLRRMEALDADLAGQIFKTEKTEAKGRDHLESHLLMFSNRAVKHTAIQGFWSNYVMTDHKPRTILLGEKGLSQAAIKAGLKVQGLIGQERMVELLSQLSDSDLLDALNNLALHNDAGKNMRSTLQSAAASGASWRESFLEWTRSELSNSRQHLVSAAYIDPACRYAGMGFLKKSNHMVFQLARLAILRGVSRGTIKQMDPIVTEEVLAMVSTWTQPDDWRHDPTVKRVAQL
jgi:hypothetical protein